MTQQCGLVPGWLDSQVRLTKIAAKLLSHSRHTCFQLTEVPIARNLPAAMLRRIRRRIEPGPV